MLGKVLGFACGGGRDCFLFLSGLLLPNQEIVFKMNTYKQRLASEDPTSLDRVNIGICDPGGASITSQGGCFA